MGRPAAGVPRLLCEARGHVCPFVYQIAVGLLNDVPEMNADAEVDASLGGQAGIALDHAVLNLIAQGSVDDGHGFPKSDASLTSSYAVN